MTVRHLKICLTASLGLVSADVSARILAVCGNSDGVAYYVAPKSTGWTKDTINKGSITFLLKDNGEPDILIKDSFEKTFSAVDDGSLVLAPFVDQKRDTFTFLLVSAKAGSVATYQLSTTADGKKVMLWTDSKNLAAGLITKVSAFVANCEPGLK